MFKRSIRAIFFVFLLPVITKFRYINENTRCQLFYYLCQASFIILYNDQQMHNLQVIV